MNYKSQTEWNRTHTERVNVKLNINTDGDIIEKLNNVPSKMGYIKKLIRDDIKKESKKMTIAETLKLYDGDFDEYEIFKKTADSNIPFHTDCCDAVDSDEVDDSTDVLFCDIMDEEAYNRSILANSSLTADFGEWYGNQTAKVLCILI